jgi:hypothetical protein
MLNKIPDLEKMEHRKIVHHDEFCYWLKLMYLFLLHPVCIANNNHQGVVQRNNTWSLQRMATENGFSEIFEIWYGVKII